MIKTFTAIISSNKPYFTVNISDGKHRVLCDFSVRNTCIVLDVPFYGNGLWLRATDGSDTLINFYKNIGNGILFIALKFPENEINNRFILVDRQYGMPINRAKFVLTS